MLYQSTAVSFFLFRYSCAADTFTTPAISCLHPTARLTVGDKRQALSQQLTPSPPLHPPVRNLAMEETVKKLVEQNAQINRKLELLCGLIPKVEEINTKIQSLMSENAALHQDVTARDAKIEQLISPCQ